MLRRSTVGLLCLTILATSAPPARAEEDPVPAWVPYTLIGSVVVGGLLYIRHLHGRREQRTLTPMESAEDLISYIATKEEKEELRRAATPREIEAFLQSFFARRDPDPGTAENEFRIEHQRRFAYANDHFRATDAGWKTDQGRVLILYGPPARTRGAEVRGQPLTGQVWKSLEFWEYDRPAGGNVIPDLFSNPAMFDDSFSGEMPDKGRMFFVFVRRSEGSLKELVYATEPGERVEPSLLR